MEEVHIMLNLIVAYKTSCGTYLFHADAMKHRSFDPFDGETESVQHVFMLRYVNGDSTIYFDLSSPVEVK